ncbi:response regulator [Nitrosophilus kaiyonis]|uniref:response regulator n=1 Tax=Nitrosophilus kaiyonis TaxID=2930200 RepID=UPI0024901527|nr:response regulator [Nitrosophilus kaiyonis]
MKKIKVLAVDDDFINLKLLKTMLLKNGMVDEVIEAKNGVEAIEILKNRKDIDLILLDIIMPVMNGIEMLKIIKSDESLKDIPVIVLSTDETKRTEALDNGANDFINKPIRENILTEKIKTYAFL